MTGPPAGLALSCPFHIISERVVTSQSPVVASSQDPFTAVPAFRREDALAAVKPELEGVDPASFVPMNIDIAAAVTTVLGCSPALLELRGQIMEELPKFDTNKVDKLVTYALAAGQANIDYLLAAQPDEPVAERHEKLTKLREVFVSDARALVKRGLVDDAMIEGLRMTQGYKYVAFDVLVLCRLFKLQWQKVSGRTGVLLKEVEEAQHLADIQDAAIGVREHTPAALNKANEARQRAWTLFVNDYEEVRRAVGYLRFHEDDAEQLAPSLWAGRNNRKRPSAQESPAAPATPVSPAVAPIAVPSTGAGTPAPAVVAPGMPGGSPFMNG